jgi:hypothetical protein
MAVQLQHVDEHHMRYTLKQLRASYRSDTVTVTLPTVGRPCSRHEVKPRTTLCTFSTRIWQQATGISAIMDLTNGIASICPDIYVPSALSSKHSQRHAHHRVHGRCTLPVSVPCVKGAH